MKLLLRFSLLLFVLITGSSCSEDLAEDGTKRGKLFFVGNVKKSGKDYTVFVYNRGETIESADQSSSTFWYWLTYTIDTKTGKIIHQTEFDVDENSGSFMGVSDTYSFFSRTDGFSAIDLHKDNTVIDPIAFKQLVGKKNPQLKEKIAYFETDGNLNLRAITKQADIYLLNPNTLKGKLIASGLIQNPQYVMKTTFPDHGNSVLLNGRIQGYIIDDTTTLALEALDETNTHKYYFYKLHHPSRKNFFEMIRHLTHQKSDSTLFLDGDLKGLTGAVVLVEYLSALGNTGVKKLGAYDLETRKFIWSKPVSSLYKYNDNGNFYTLYWNPDGKSFFIYSSEYHYTPVSLVNAATGKIIWKF